MKKSVKKLFTTILILSLVSMTLSSCSAQNIFGDSIFRFEYHKETDSYELDRVAGKDYLLGKITVPDTYNGKAVTSIGSEAFYDCGSLTSVTIPDSVTSIGNYAFCDCWFLTSVTIPDSVTSIGGSAFYNCNSLTSITIPDSVTSIGNRAFSLCDNLTSITVDENNQYYKSIDGNLYTKDGTTLVQYAIGKKDTSFVIPDSVTTIGERAFSHCDSLTSITIPDSVTSIGRYAFSGTAYYNNENNWVDGVLYIGNRLIVAKDTISGEYVIKDGTLTIEGHAFQGCDSLTNITIPDSVTSIGDFAFYSCDSLESVVIGDSVTSIGYHAFFGCSSLTDVYYAGTEEEWAKISINSSNTHLIGAIIHYNYVPEE